MSEPVVADPQFGIVRILRPYLGFDAQDPGSGVPAGSYQGQNGNLPIMFSEGGQALDDQAGKPGFGPNLIKGLSVSMGARIQIWLPNIFIDGDNFYQWIFVWRLRNTFDYRTQRVAYHYPKQGHGFPATLTAGGGFGADIGPRTILPASWHASVYNQAEPDTSTTPFANQHLVAESIQVTPPETAILPLTPSGNFGAFQQGLSDPAFAPTAAAYMPLYSAFDVQAVGDELMLGAIKSNGTTFPAWDFSLTGEDFVFSLAFGSGGQLLTPPVGPFPDIGVYVMNGSAP